LLEIRELIQPTIIFQHFKGHQGTDLSDEFDLQTNLNILMDSRAKRMQQVIQDTPNWINQTIIKFYTTMRQSMERLSSHSGKKLAAHNCVYIIKTKFKEKYDNILWESLIFARQNGNPKKGVIKMIQNIAQLKSRNREDI
jgi:hypothetical protein